MLTKYNPVLASTDSAGNTGESSSPTSTSSVWGNGASSPTPKMESAYTAIGDKIYIIAGYGETGKGIRIVSRCMILKLIRGRPLHLCQSI